jgi:hypothetical protein
MRGNRMPGIDGLSLMEISLMIVGVGTTYCIFQIIDLQCKIYNLERLLMFKNSKKNRDKNNDK